MADFLLEIGLEEIPARMIAGAEAELGRKVTELLTRERLLAADGRVTTYSTPRRLAVRVEGLAAAQPDTQEEMTGPSWKIAFPNGEAGPAAVAFAKKAGVEVAALRKVVSAKGEYVGATVERKGRAAAELLAAELPKEVLSLYWAKNMYWRAGKPERFVRPVRWLVALLDSAVIPLEIAGIAAGNLSRGHRILHGEAPVLIAEPSVYALALRVAYVEPDVAARRHTIRKTLDLVTRTIAETPGARWREDEELVETVVHLTEWPTALYGSFEHEYLALPEEVLVTVMRDHQKYFAVEDAEGKLAPHFLTVLNTQVDEQGRAIIRHGNERVLRSRFKDAQFFWETDQKIPLVDRLEMLKAVTFQKELGNYFWKTEGNLSAASRLAAILEDRGFTGFSGESLFAAVRLAKTDLTAELVKEFTELQGVVGGLYARSQGLGEIVATAIYAQYTPASMEDAIPVTVEGQLLGLADRIHTIVAMFGIGSAPTGSRDPFALRRAANSIVKILAESELPLTLRDLLAAADGGESNLDVAAFFQERISFFLREVCGFRYDVVRAVLATDLAIFHGLMRSDDVRDLVARANALTDALGSKDFLEVSAAFKRMKNMIRQAQDKYGVSPEPDPIPTLMIEPEGARLLEESDLIQPELQDQLGLRKYNEVFALMATLRPHVDAFFNKPVIVDHSDPSLRNARLALLRRVFFGLAVIADFSEIVVA